MPIYILYTHDDRYSTPTMEVVTAADTAGARAAAKLRLDASAHHMAVEIWCDDELVGRISDASL
ncbi:MAG: hypothetical protein ACREEB_17895 [Caulobacteraceae bacterium]